MQAKPQVGTPRRSMTKREYNNKRAELLISDFERSAVNRGSARDVMAGFYFRNSRSEGLPQPIESPRFSTTQIEEEEKKGTAQDDFLLNQRRARNDEGQAAAGFERDPIEQFSFRNHHTVKKQALAWHHEEEPPLLD